MAWSRLARRHRSRHLLRLVATASLVACGAAVASSPTPPPAGASTATAATVTLSASPSAVTVGGPMTLTAQVSGSSPTGDVTFLDDGSPLACGTSGTEGLSSSGASASCVVSSTPGPAGEQSLSALYLGDTGNLPASSSIEEKVAAVATATTLSAPAAAVDASVTYSASVTAGGAPVTGGSVTFSDDGSPLPSCSDLRASTGTATCTFPGYSEPGFHDIEAAFSPPTGLGPSLDSAVEQVGAVSVVSTSTTLLPSSGDPAATSATALAAVVTSDATAPPAGTVTFTDDAVAIPGCSDLAIDPAAGTSQAGSSCTLPSGLGAAGPHDLQALFLPASGSGLAASSSPPSTVTASAGTAAVDVAASPDPAPGGSPVSIHVSVTADATQQPAAGSVQVLVGGTPASCASAPGGLVTLSSGTATCTLGAPASGTTLVTAAYRGAPSLLPATAVAPLTVQPVLAATTVTVTSSANPTPIGSAVAYTAIVSGGATPTGTVTFAANGALISGCAALPLTAGKATCATSGSSTSGSVVVTATYAPDASHRQGLGQLTEIVGSTALPAPTVELASSSNPVANGHSVAFSAVVSGASDVSAGTVSFASDGSPISGCTSLPLSASTTSTFQALCTISSGFTTSLSHSIVATYSGVPGDLEPGSAALNEAVLGAKASSQLIAQPNLTASSPNEELDLALQGDLGQPGGSVTFNNDGQLISLCKNMSIASGISTCALPELAAGVAADFTAQYSGDEFYAPSATALADETTSTGSKPATIALDATTAPTVGTDVRFTAAVTALTGTPTGTVTFADGSSPLTTCGANGTVSLSSGTATCDAGTSLVAGIHDVVATYSGDATYAPGAALIAETVAPTTTSSSGSGGGSSGSTSTSGTSGTSGTGGTGSTGSTSTGSTSTGSTSTGSTSTGSTGGGYTGTGGSTTVGGIAPGETAPASGNGGGAAPTGSTSAGKGSTDSSGSGAASGSGSTNANHPSKRGPVVALSVPRTTRRSHSVVYRAHVKQSRGNVTGTVSFRVDGRPVRGCTRIRLTGARSLNVTCKMRGFATAGYDVVSVRYTSRAHHGTRTATALERVLPHWNGYWLVSRAGHLRGAGHTPKLADRRRSRLFVAAVMTPNARGVLLLARDGKVRALGAARVEGSGLARQGPFVGLAPTRDGRGYWLLSRQGRVLAFGDAGHLGSARATRRTGPFVAIAATPDGKGYWLLSARGVVVARGDARRWPRRGAAPRPQRYVAIAPSADGHGYLVLGATGRLVRYGDAPAVPSRAVRAPRGADGYVGILLPAGRHGIWLATRHGEVVAVDHPPALAPPRPRPGPPIVAIAGT